MGVKLLREKYNIKYIVQERDNNILIGSPYVQDIIIISKEGKIVKHYDNSWTKIKELTELNQLLIKEEEAGTLEKIINAKDTFSKSLPIYTYDKGSVILDYCEKYDYPNTTHSGKLIDSLFYISKEEAYERLLNSTASSLKWYFKMNLKDAFIRMKNTILFFFKILGYWLKARTIGRIYVKKIR